MASINDRNLNLGEGIKFQLILVGYDPTEEGNANYITSKKLNFPALKVEGREPVFPVLMVGNTGSIPQIVVMKPDGELITNDEAKALAMLEELVPAEEQ